MSDIPIFPIDTKQRDVKCKSDQQNTGRTKKRVHSKTRWDKTHSMKFPVTMKQEMEIRKLWKRHKSTLEVIHDRDISLTKFNTMLLRFGLRNKDIVREHLYENTGTYKTVKPNQVEYELIGGIEGMAINLGVSERRALTYIMLSVLEYMSSGGQLNYESLEPIKPNR